MNKRWKIVAKAMLTDESRATFKTVLEAKDAAEAWMQFSSMNLEELQWRYIKVTEVKHDDQREKQ